MGGNAFEKTRNVKYQDLISINAIIRDIAVKYDGLIDWTFCGSNIGLMSEYRRNGERSRECGDIDLLIYTYDAGYYNFREMITDKFKSIASGHRTIGKSDHFLIDGFQVDVNWTDNQELIGWVAGASFSADLDPYKTLFRNEVLFAAAKYFPKPGEVLTYIDGFPVQYSRNAFTVYDGFVRNYYSIQSKRNPFILNKNPRKENSVLIHTDFDRFLTTGYFKGVGRDFKSIFEATLQMYEEQSIYIILDVCKGLMRKKMPIPKEIGEKFDIEELMKP